MLFKSFISRVVIADKRYLFHFICQSALNRMSSTARPWETNPLLPKDVVPRHYDIFLDPQIDAGTFSGKVEIALNVLSPKDHIILHSKLLTISSSQLFTADEAEVPIQTAFEYAPNEFWIVQSKDCLSPGNYSLHLKFNGSLLNRLEGFYRSSYTKKDGSTSYLAATKFEPTYARKSFPCFDEPAFKASFSTKLVRPAEGNYIAISNMNQIAEIPDSPEKGRVTVEFAKTPLMSTYLACFIVCDFPHLPSVNVKSSNTLLTVYAREGQLNAAKHALNLSTNVLDHFNKYFGMNYPLPKLDLIAVPDFVSGAMENWGLITFRESRMLAEPTAAASDILATSNTIAHELAHMWFGDIVTMGWWDDLWLNEGFATFLANRATCWLLPDYPSEAVFALNYLQYVMVDDEAISSHPIIRPVSKPDQITEAFDAISYQKGSSVLRMVENFDPEGFRKAVVRYLNAHVYSNANTSDLWAQLDVEYKKVDKVSRMLDTWTKQMGFPIIVVEKKENSLVLKQIRCLSNVNISYDKSTSPYGYKWDIPVKYITSASKEPKSLVMKLEDESVSEAVPEGVKWFKLNADQVGFYRVNYAEAEWKNLQNILMENPNVSPSGDMVQFRITVFDFITRHLPQVMSSIDRANLIDDAFSLAKAGYINYEIPLNLISYFKMGKENEWAPWNRLSIYYSRLKDLLFSSEEASNDLVGYVKKLIAPYLNESIYNIKTDDLPQDRYLKSTIVSLACRIGDEQCLNKVNKLYNVWIEGKSNPPIDIKAAVYSYGMRGPNLRDNWMHIWKRYLVESDPLEKEILQEALESVTDPILIHQLLEFAKNESLIRSQDYFLVLVGLSKSPEGNAIIWEWSRNNWDYLINRFTLNHRQFGRLLPALATRFYTEQRLKELEDLIEKYPSAGAGAAGRLKAISVTKANIVLFKDYQPVIKTILKNLVAEV